MSEWPLLPEQVSYLRKLGTNMARGARPCAVPGCHFIQGPDCASVWRSVWPARRQGFEGGGDWRWDFTWGRRDRDGTWHLHSNSKRWRVCEVGASVDRSGGAAMTELLPLLPLVQLPHHSLLGGHTLIGGHAEVAEPVMGILVVTGQVACCWRRVAARWETRRLWQRLIGGIRCAGFGL